MDKTMSRRKVGAFFGFCFAKERKKALKGEPGSILQVNFFSVMFFSTRDVPTASFYKVI